MVTKEKMLEVSYPLSFILVIFLGFYGVPCASYTTLAQAISTALAAVTMAILLLHAYIARNDENSPIRRFYVGVQP